MLRMKLTVMIAAAALVFSAGCSDDAPVVKKRRGPTTRPSFGGSRRGPTTRSATGTTRRAPATGPSTRTTRRAPKPSTPTKAKNPVVVIETSMGTIKAELWLDKAPITVKNFLRYVDEKHYDNMIFHRVMKGFMVQGGGFDVMMRQKPTHADIRNEATGDKENLRGTLAMARRDEVHSASSQFFINHADNAFLDHRDETMRGFGYCAFGKVIDGLDVVDKIAAVAVATVSGHKNVPVEPVLIKSIRRAK